MRGIAANCTGPRLRRGVGDGVGCYGGFAQHSRRSLAMELCLKADIPFLFADAGKASAGMGWQADQRD